MASKGKDKTPVDQLIARITAEYDTLSKQLKVIARAGVGLDNVDVKAATQAGVMVVNAPTSNIVSRAIRLCKFQRSIAIDNMKPPRNKKISGWA